MTKVIYLNKKGSRGDEKLAEEKYLLNGDIETYKQERDNLVRISKIILYYANKSRAKLYKTKLHKLLFYTQFIYFRENGERLLKEDFIKGYYGPVMENLDQVLESVKEAGIIKLGNNNYGTYIEANMKMNDKEYEASELKVLKRVNDKFSDYTSYDISEYSHLEKLWKDAPVRGVISLSKADELNEF